MRDNARAQMAFGAGLLCVIAATAAFAHHPGGPGNTTGAGPINTISASTLAQGTGVAGIVVDYTNLERLSDATLLEEAMHAHEDGEEHSHVHSLDSITSPSLTIGYGITNDLMVALRLPYVVRAGIREGHVHEHEPGEIEAADSSGIGDLSALAQWRFLNNDVSGMEAAVLFGAKAPTGKTRREGGGRETRRRVSAWIWLLRRPIRPCSHTTL